jgi:hypothetical protein
MTVCAVTLACEEEIEFPGHLNFLQEGFLFNTPEFSTISFSVRFFHSFAIAWKLSWDVDNEDRRNIKLLLL